MFKIVYTYQTGGTFELYDSEGELDYQFADLDDAKLALKRMREHYEWRDSHSTSYGDDLPQPDWWKPDPKAGRWGDPTWSFNVMDQGKEVWIYAGEYLGYFETLYNASIKAVEPDTSDMEFNLRGY